MLGQINQLIGFIFAAIGFAFSLYYLLRSSKMEKIVHELLEHAESLKIDCETLFSKLSKAESAAKEIEARHSTLVAVDAENHKKINDLEIILENKDTELKKLANNIKSTESTANTQVSSLNKQLDELKSENYELLKKMDIVETTIKEKAVKDISQANSKLKEAETRLDEKDKALKSSTATIGELTDINTNLTQEIAELKLKVEQLEEQVTTDVHTESSENETELTAKVERYKKRLQRSAYFYNAMRGQKEMAEERYKNWEVALELLSNWVLQEKGVTAPTKSLGPLVGEALAQINREAVLGELALDNNAEDEFAAILGASASPDMSL